MNTHFETLAKPSMTVLMAAVMAVPAWSQVNYSDFIHSGGEMTSYSKPAVYERRFVPGPSLREADVKYSKRIVRCIDTRQKMNKQLEWPRQPLSGVLRNGLMEGSIVPYRNDSMSSAYTVTGIRDRLGYWKVVSISVNPEDPEETIDTSIWIEYDFSKIHKYWIMEDWIFDYKHSKFSPKIIGLAPVYRPELETLVGNEQPMCWIRMDDIRQTLANTEMFNRYNDAARLSYDDFFQMRIFDSYIVYESNVFDNYISQFEEYENDQVAALLKSDAVKNDLFIFEHDLWQF